MLDYSFVNLNPKGKKTGDCTTRAIANALNISYEEALKKQYELSLKTGYSLYDIKLVDKLLSSEGFVKQKQPKHSNGKIFTLGEIDLLLFPTYNKVIVSVRGHHITCVDCYNCYDIWDCRKKAIRNYWIKEA